MPVGKRSSSGHHRDQPPWSPDHKSSPCSRSPPPRVVTPRGFTSTSTSSLNYLPSYPSNVIRRSSANRRSPSPAPPSTPSRSHATASAHSLLIFSHDGPDKSPFTSLLSLARPSNPIHREAVRTVTSVLCKEILRPSQGASLEVRESEEVECLMRAIARFERVWGRGGAFTNWSMTACFAGQCGRGRARRESQDCSQKRCGMSMSCACE